MLSTLPYNSYFTDYHQKAHTTPRRLPFFYFHLVGFLRELEGYVSASRNAFCDPRRQPQPFEGGNTSYVGDFSSGEVFCSSDTDQRRLQSPPGARSDNEAHLAQVSFRALLDSFNHFAFRFLIV